MKLVTYDTPAGRGWGLLEGDSIAAISEAPEPRRRSAARWRSLMRRR